MRISDWSSDVCSSDLAARADHIHPLIEIAASVELAERQQNIGGEDDRGRGPADDLDDDDFGAHALLLQMKTPAPVKGRALIASAVCRVRRRVCAAHSGGCRRSYNIRPRSPYRCGRACRS